jgi:hypothetical protein
MRSITVCFGLAGLLLAWPVGCGKESQKEAEAKARKAKDDTVVSLQERVNGLQNEADKLKAQAEVKGGDIRAMYDKELKLDLDKKMDAAKVRLAKLKAETSPTWEAAKAEVQSAIDEAKRACDQAADRMKQFGMAEEKGMKARDAFVKDMQEKVAACQADSDKLKARAEAMGGEILSTFSAEVKPAVDKKMKNAGDMLGKVKEQGGMTWESAKTGAQSAVEELKSGCEMAETQLKQAAEKAESKAAAARDEFAAALQAKTHAIRAEIDNLKTQARAGGDDILDFEKKLQPDLVGKCDRAAAAAAKLKAGNAMTWEAMKADAQAAVDEARRACSAAETQVRQAAEKAAARAAEARDEFAKGLEARLDAAQEDMHKLITQAETAGGDTLAAFNNETRPALERKVKEARATLAKLKGQSGMTWQGMKTQAEAAIDAVKQACEQAAKPAP